MSIASKFTNLVFKIRPSKRPGQIHDYVKERQRNEKRIVPKIPKGVELEEINLNGFIADKISKQANDKGLIMYIHGGGFTSGSARERRIITYYLVDKYLYNCISINYSLAPENKWPSMLEDCYVAYQNILDMGYDPKNIIFMGESAGGCLVLSLGLLLKDRNIPQPKAIVSFSPCTDMYTDLPSHTNNIKTDYMLKDAISKGLADVMFEDTPTEKQLKDYLLSPYYGDYNGLPPIHLSASDSETLYDDSVVLYNKLKNSNHHVVMETEHDACHAYQIMSYMPESKRLIKKVFKFIEELGE